MPDKADFFGMTPDDIRNIQQQQTQEPKEGSQQPEQGQQQQEPVQKQAQGQQQQAQGQQNGPQVDEKDINTLKNTFGVDFDEVPENLREKIVNVAKSYREAQGRFTKEQEQRQLYESTLNNFQTRLQQYPDVWDTVEKVARGEYTGNSPKEEPKGQPRPKSQPEVADEQTLINEGYLTASELDGLDDISKSRVVARAEILYHKDKQLEEAERQIQERFEKVEKDRMQKATQERVVTTNKKRFEDSFDRFVSEYGVDFTSLDDTTLNSIRQRASNIRDPQDPSLLDVDAFYDAAVKELSVRGKLPTRKEPTQSGGVREILDSGFSSQRRTPQSQPKSIQDEMDEHMRERWANINNNLSTNWTRK